MCIALSGEIDLANAAAVDDEIGAVVSHQPSVCGRPDRSQLHGQCCKARRLGYPKLELVRILTNHDFDLASPLACLLVGQPPCAAE
jgi:hypothetical protein